MSASSSIGSHRQRAPNSIPAAAVLAKFCPHKRYRTANRQFRAAQESSDLVRFVDRSMAAGHETALQEVYDISSANQLEELWNERAIKAALAAN